jgi:hypothetical protein
MLAGMAGGGGEDENAGGGEPTPGGGMAAMMGQAVSKIRETEMTLQQLARQFPGSAPALREAQTLISRAVIALNTALKQVITQPGQPEPPAPALGG